MKNRAPEFTEATVYIYLFGEKLAVLDRISQRIVKEQYGINRVRDYQEFKERYRNDVKLYVITFRFITP